MASGEAVKIRSNKDLVPIYTDWANHYLEKSHKRRLIGDLQKDLQDSLLLVDVVEAVTAAQVPDIKAKPRNQAQVVENIGACLRFAENLGADVDGITAKDILDGQLKAILGLFFSLSKYKQQQKAASAKPTASPASGIPSVAAVKMSATTAASRLPSPFKSSAPPAAAASAIPALSSSAPTRSLQPPSAPKSKPVPKAAAKPTAVSSGIPAPGPAAPRSQSATRGPSRLQSPQPIAVQNSKMLEKLKLFGSKEKSGSSQSPRTGNGVSTPKSTSANSSSGVSSDRSEPIDASAKSSALKSLRRGLRSPKTPTKASKTAKPEKAAKVSGAAQTSPQLLRKRQTGGVSADLVNVAELRSSRCSEETDADSAYAGFGSASPSSSNAPSETKERRSPVGAESAVVSPRSPSTQIPKCGGASAAPVGSPKPVLAVKGIAAKPPIASAKAGMTKPTSLQKPVSKQSASSSVESPRQPTSAAHPSPTVGVVSPMTHHKPLVTRGTDGGAQSDSNSSQTSGSREDSDTVSVIYCPAAIPVANDTQQLSKAAVSGGSSSASLTTAANRTSSRLETTFDSSDGVVTTQTLAAAAAGNAPPSHSNSDDLLKPMEPLVPRSSPYGYFKGLTHQVPSAKKSHLTLNRPISAAVEAAPMTEGEASARNAGDQVATAGYVSDGDALNAALNGPLADLNAADASAAGYMSEGGINLYKRRMEARFREGLEAVRDSMRRPPNANDPMHDSFEDSSSLSSGLSENIEDLSTDDLTGSSLSDPQMAAVYSKETSVVGIRPNNRYGSSGPTPAQRLLVQQQQQRARSGKAECAQQTEPRLAPRGQNASCSALQQRKLSEQENIDQLLQRCRTSARGLGANAPQAYGSLSRQSQVGVYSSRTMQAAPIGSRQYVELSADGDMLHVSAEQSPSGRHAAQQRSLRRPGSAQGGDMPSPPGFSGYHSLDRKRHLIRHYMAASNGVYDSVPDETAVAMQQRAATMMALVSPRRYANGSLSLPVSHEGPLPDESLHSNAACNRRSVSGKAMMSRSMIEAKQQLSVAAPSIQLRRVDEQRARMSVPPSVPVDGQSRCIRSPAGGIGGGDAQKEGIYANLVHRYSGADVPTTSAQLQLHRLTGGSLSSAQTLQSQPSPYMATVLSRTGSGSSVPPDPGDPVHASSLSLASTTSHSTQSEERYQAEIRKLHREVEAYREKVSTLTAQQNTYASMVQAFEKALQGMVKRVESLQLQSNHKDTEVTDLRTKIDLLRSLSSQAGINVDQVIRANSPALHRRHTFTESQEPGLVRQPSCESVLSQKSTLSSSSKGSRNDKFGPPSGASAKSKKSWIRSSFSRAFSKNKKQRNGCVSDVEGRQAESYGGSPLNSARSDGSPQLKSIGSASASVGRALQPVSAAPFRLHEMDVESEAVVSVLRKQLNEKDSAMTDLRLEALTAAQRVDELKEALIQLRNENSNLRESKERRAPGTTGSQVSLPAVCDAPSPPMDAVGRATVSERAYRASTSSFDDGKEGWSRLRVAVIFSGSRDSTNRILIGNIPFGSRMTWDMLDEEIGRLFNEYLHRIDPVASLNMNNVESVLGVHCGGVCYLRRDPLPKLPPANFFSLTAGAVEQATLDVILRSAKQSSVDELALEMLLPKKNVQRLVLQLMEQRRVILCGACGTGKAQLARKLAEYVVRRGGGAPDAEHIEVAAVSEADAARCSAKLHRRLDALVQRLRRAASSPLVIIVENVHHIQRVDEVFAPLADLRQLSTECYVIGTMNQTSAVTNLQIQHGFRFVLWVNHMDPVKEFLGRHLRRRLIDEECRRGERMHEEMARVLDFLPKVWTNLNKLLEPADATIGPRVFMDCPLSAEASRRWFVDLWNSTIQPYLLRTARDASQLHDRRGAALDEPADLVCEQWPWTTGEPPDELIARLSPADVALCPAKAAAPADPLVMLMRLQQQASRDEAQTPAF